LISLAQLPTHGTYGPWQFWSGMFIGSTAVQFIALLPSAFFPPTILRALTSIILAATVGTSMAIAIAQIRPCGTWQSDFGISEAVLQLQDLAVAGLLAAFLAVILWRRRSRRKHARPAHEA